MNFSVLRFHCYYFSFAVFFHSFHDHADSTNLTLPGNKFYLLVLSKLFLDEFNRLINIDMIDSFEFALFSDRGEFFGCFRHFNMNMITLG